MKYCKAIILLLVIITVATGAFVCPVNTFGAESPITFPQISASMLTGELEPVIKKGHPFIVADSDNFDRVREYAFGKDETITRQYELIKAKASSLLDEPLLKVSADVANSSYIGTAISFWNNIMNLALVWQIEGDERYAQRAYEQTLYFCNMSSWGTYQMIDNVQTAFGVALCYDWLYGWLSDEQKDTLVCALRNLHLDEISDLYDNRSKPEYKWSFHQNVFASNNHGLMNNTLTFLAAMAIAETDMEFCTDVMEHATQNLERCFAHWYPDSAWFEGVGYWGYAGPYMARYFLTMKNAFGHCFGYEDIDCLMNASDFVIYAQSSQGAFVWDDMGISVNQKSPIIYSYGVLKEDIGLQKYALENTPVHTSPDPVFCLEYNPHTNYDSELELNLDKHFRDIDMVTMRNTFDSDQEIWCGMAVQESRSTNGMMNSGTVALDALGERWIMNHGRENYYKGYWEQDGRRWQYYRTRAEANSCIVINPSEYGGQNIDSKDVIDTFVSSPGSAFAISDLTETYKGQVSSYKRGINLFNNRRTFVVQDEIVLTEASELYSFFNIYKSDIEILEDGKSAIISKGTKKLYVDVNCDNDFTFSVMECEPLPTSPVPENPNSDNSDFQKLAIHIKNASSANIRVTFTPYLCDSEIEHISFLPFIPMNQWEKEDELKEAKLSAIYVNGKKINNFNPDQRYYDIINNSNSCSVTAKADEDLYNVTVASKNGGKRAEIFVSDKSDPSVFNTYVVDLSGKSKLTYPKSTYTHTTFKGVMMPQEFYRMQNSKDKGIFYVKDTAPANVKSAVLILYTSVVGESLPTKLKACNINWDKDLKYLSMLKSGICVDEDFIASISGTPSSVYSEKMTETVYDITEFIPENGGDYTLAMIPYYSNADFLNVASHRNSDATLRPVIEYIYEQ